MKKFFMFAAMASVALVSCVKNETATLVADQDEVTFVSPVLAPSVKSVTETVEGAFTSAFKVWGYFTAAEQVAFAPSALYMNGVNIKLTDGVWKSSDGKYYWPNNGYLTFVGYAPSSAIGTYSVGNNGLNITGYTVGEDADEDLLVSKISYNNTKLNAAEDHGTAAYSNGAEIVFEHALSSIQFTVKTTADIVDNNYTLVVKKITILNAESKGDFAQVLDATSNQMEASEAANDGWSPKNVPANYVAYNNAEGLTLTAAAQFTNGAAAQTANKTDLILLPQVIGDDVKLEVQYTLKNASMGTADPILQTTTVDLNETTVLQWLRGKRYTYNLTIKLDEITFDPEVSAWVAGDAQDNDVTPDYN